MVFEEDQHTPSSDPDGLSLDNMVGKLMAVHKMVLKNVIAT